MKKYDEYKESGFGWIGEVPSLWNNLRLRFVCEFRNGYTPSKANPEFWEDGSIPWYRMEDIRETGRKLNEAKQYITKEAVKGGGLFEAGSFILATTATIGEHAVLIVDSLANQQFTNLKIRKSLEATLLRDYFYYYLFVIDDYCKATTKTSTFPAVSMELLKNCHVVFPSPEQQQNIVDYLDKKCGEIDRVISAQQKRIALLQELKQSAITHVVTKGLNPNVEMKDSGVEWIGEVPKHWEVCRFKDFISLKTDASISDVKIGLENIESKSGKFIETSTEFEGNGVAFAKADVVYGKLRPYLQKVWLAEFDGNAVGDFFVFRAKRNSTPSFIKYLLLSDGFTKEADGSTVGAKMPRVSSNFILTMHYCLPTKGEQHAIATYLDKKCASIDSSISKAQHQVALLQEYKQSLITEVVTGKRKVC